MRSSTSSGVRPEIPKPGPSSPTSGVVALDDVTSERVLAAARIEAEHPMALGDAFAAATAIAYDAPLFTGDPELLDREGPWRAVDLR